MLKQSAEGIPVAGVYRKAGISQATHLNWKKNCDGLLPTEMRRLKPLEDENSKLKNIGADLTQERVCAGAGYPKTIRVDQKSEFVSRDVDLWAHAHDVTLNVSRPGKPTANAYIEAFKGRSWAQCVNTHWFLTLADAREEMEAWRRYDNVERPHGPVGDKVPCELQDPDGATTPPS